MVDRSQRDRGLSLAPQCPWAPEDGGNISFFRCSDCSVARLNKTPMLLQLPHCIAPCKNTTIVLNPFLKAENGTKTGITPHPQPQDYAFCLLRERKV